MECWLQVPDFPNYEVSDMGRLRRGLRELRGYPSKRGHVDTSLRRGGKTYRRYMHVLVLTAFVGPRPIGLEGCHADGNPSNNRLTNLRWDTHKGNMEDAVHHGTTTRKEQCVRGHPLAGNQYSSNGGCITCIKDRARVRRLNGYVSPSRRRG